MVCNPNPIRLALLGAGGIGKIQAQVFHELGARICSVLGSTEESSALAASNLEETLGYPIQSFVDLNELLQNSVPQAVTICTPHHLHFEQTMAAMDRDLPVFCEKPMFWRDGIMQQEIDDNLQSIRRHSGRQLFVNTCNASMIDSVQSWLPTVDSVRKFSFQFHTQGKYRGLDIAVDLLPHGLSLLIRLLGEMQISDLKATAAASHYSCSFKYGDCDVAFDFQQGKSIAKKLQFGVNQLEFFRVQQGAGSSYRVFLREQKSGEQIEVQNPMVVSASQFLKHCQSGSSNNSDGFEEAAINLRMMAEILRQS